ncbi:DUF4262 domain-containing protein [Allokutzneria multivorans]
MESMCDMCGGASVEDVRRQLMSRVAEHDFSMVAVQGEHDPQQGRNHPGFVYSVGLWCMHRAPEVLVIAPRALAAELVQCYAERIIAGETFEPGVGYDGFFDGYPVMFEFVGPRHYPEWLASGFFLYPDGEFPVLQMLWPDEDRVWPWQNGADPRVKARQPVLTDSGVPETWMSGVTGP